MKLYKQLTLGFSLGGWTLLVLCGNAVAQWSLDGSAPRTTSASGQWQQRVVQNGHVQTVASDSQMATRPIPQQRSAVIGATGAVRSGGVRQAALFDDDSSMSGSVEEIPLGKAQPQAKGKMVMESDYGDMGSISSSSSSCNCGGGGQFGGGGESCSCGECGGCGECEECEMYGGGCRPCFAEWLFREFSMFAGIQGFKGPADQGRNGNFGFNEGFNTGGSLGTPWPVGFQIGFRAAQSNLSGDRVDVVDENNPHGATRHQIFITAGVFKRAMCGGLQWGIAFDYLHDSYFYTYFNDQSADLRQIRSETSFVGPCGNEIGFSGTYAVGGKEIDRRIRNLQNLQLNPTDMFTFFFRRQFEGHGEGRIWAGLSGHGDGIVGAELTLPIGKSWALENRINYLIPKQGHGDEGQVKEAWGMSAQLVWYPGRRAACVTSDCYRPLFGVADNANFMIRGSEAGQ
jgi:hypothetical protein